ncbi:cytochrome P450 [Mycena galopus ATCC 62051]|nr:cytochrome P450 [Mycena galopus ATCC 62051]
MLQLMLPPTYGQYEFQWQKRHGMVYRLKGCFGQDRLMVSDPTAMQHILNSPHFKFGPSIENGAHLLYGEGNVMSANAEEHKRLRAALNVGFTGAAVRNHIPVFERAVQTLCEHLEDCPGVSTNICPLLAYATLSTMSEAVLGCSIEDLGEEFISNNFQIIAIAASQSATQILGSAIIPRVLLSAGAYLPTPAFKAIRRAKYLSNQIGSRVVQDKKNAADQGMAINTDVYGELLARHYSGAAKNTLDEDEIIAQTTIILIAGQDTTATTLSFGLVELAKAPEFQAKLRAEIHSTIGGGNDSIAYDNMPVLNAFIKESLRMYPAEAISERMAVEDTTIPLTEGITTSTGEHLSHLIVGKGQIVSLAVASYQRLESRWGKDAHEFKPSRWLDGSVSTGEAVGPYANLLSFMGGPRTCLGWRFAILEMQVFLCELVGKFSFALPAEGPPRTRFAGTLQPAMLDDQKCALLLIERV